MPHDESTPDQLWTYIEARRQGGTAHKNGHGGSATNGSGPNIDSALVDALFQTLRDTDPAAACDGVAARARLPQEIAGAPTARSPLAPLRQALWQMSSRRQLALAVALILITVAAMAFIAWSSWSATCHTAEAPVAGSSWAASASTRPREPRIASPGAIGTAQLVAAPSANLVAPHSCKLPVARPMISTVR
jgi:hypothetical protein